MRDVGRSEARARSASRACRDLGLPDAFTGAIRSGEGRIEHEHPRRRLERVRPRAGERRRPGRSIPTASTPPSPRALGAGRGHRGLDRHARTSPSTACRRRASTRPTCCSGGATRRTARCRDEIVDRVAAARPRGHGPDRPALRPLLEDLQAADGHALHPALARGRRARAALGRSTASHPIAAGLGDRDRAPERGDVRRALPRARAAGDRVHLLVRGRRGVPLRPDLPARRGPDLLLPPRPRDLPDLPRRQRPDRAAQRRALGPQPGARLDATSPRRRTCPSTQAPRADRREGRHRCTRPARRASGERGTAAPHPRHRRHRAPPRRALRAHPRLQRRRRRRHQPRARPRLRRRPRHPARLRHPRRGARLGRVRRRGQLDARRRPQATTLAAPRRRQAGLLREAAGA